MCCFLITLSNCKKKYVSKTVAADSKELGETINLNPRNIHLME